jgi:hypothetical protein
MPPIGDIRNVGSVIFVLVGALLVSYRLYPAVESPDSSTHKIHQDGIHVHTNSYASSFLGYGHNNDSGYNLPLHVNNHGDLRKLVYVHILYITHVYTM